MTRWVSVVAGAAFGSCLCGLSLATAQSLLDGPLGRDAGGVAVIESRVLTPDARSQVILDKVELQLLADGQRALRGSSLHRERQGHHAFFFVADPATGTYRTFTLDGAPTDNPDLREFMEENAARVKVEAAATRARARSFITSTPRTRELDRKPGPMPSIPIDEVCEPAPIEWTG